MAPAAPGARLDKELLAERGRETVGDGAREIVGGAAGREGVDDAHRLVGPVLRGGG